eukprot:CAMPEP_0195585186 /NCGR_PEP_ID=MMETSP0814-20130614/27087_1 /TAXON_ID=97485 /ORGANISM="Prymnesium parvum, Strain Texoma1" /LENGTH=54 /DNA_ID=CAMNT_0040723421 /DNA_START=157 /DNA_END=317 /DNA_ORIENTATION=+
MTPALKYERRPSSKELLVVKHGTWKLSAENSSSADMLSRTAEKAGARNISSKLA